MKKIVIAGGSGLIGKELAKILAGEGYQVIILSRGSRKSNNKQIDYVKWDPGNGELPVTALQNTNVIINLAGRNVADKRWNNVFKKEILESRVNTTKLLVDFYNNTGSTELEHFIQASAVGYYGEDSHLPHTENSPAGNDFMATVCKAWESEAQKLRTSNERILTTVRIGVVLAPGGGAFAELVKPVKIGFGVVLGSGKQVMSWIHIYDLFKMLQYIIENKNNGTFNAVSPNPISHKTLIYESAKALKRPLWLPKVPSFILKLILGEFSGVLLGSSTVSAQKIMCAGFKFKFPEISTAVKDLLEK